MPVGGRPVRLPPVAEFVADRSLVKPVARQRRGREKGPVDRRERHPRPVQPGAAERLERFRVDLLDLGKAAKLALRAVPIAVAVAVLGRQLAFRQHVDDLDARNDMHRKRQRRLPARCGRPLVGDIEAGRRGVVDPGDRAAVIVRRPEQVGFAPAGEVEEEEAVALAAVGRAGPENALDARTQDVRQADRRWIGDGRRAGDGDGRAPAIAALIDPERHAVGADIDDVGQAVAVHVADKDPARVVAVGESRAIRHMDALAPAAPAEVRPVVDIAVIDERDVPQPVAGEIRPSDARVREVHIRENLERLPLGRRGLAPSEAGPAVEVFEPGAGAHGVGDAVAVQIDEAHLGIFQIETRSLAVAPERRACPAAVKAERKVARQRAIGDEQIGAAVAVGIDKLHASIRQAETSRRVRHGAGRGKDAGAEIAPVAHGAVDLDEIGQSAAEEVDEVERLVGERARRQAMAAQGAEAPLRRLEGRVAKLQCGHGFRRRAVMPDDLDACEKRRAVRGRLSGRSGLLIEIRQRVAADQPVRVGVRGDGDPRAAPAGPDLEARAVFRERIGSVRVVECHRHQKLRAARRLVVDISDAGEQVLVPFAWPICAAIGQIVVGDDVAEGISRLGELPAEDLVSLPWPGDGCRVGAPRCRRSIDARQTVLAAHLPEIIDGIAMVQDFGEEAFRTRAVASGRARRADQHEVLRAGQDEDILRIVVARHALRHLTGDRRHAERPAEAEGAIAVAAAVGERQRRLEAAAPFRKRDRNGEIAGAGVEIGCEFFADPGQRTTTLRQADDIRGGVRHRQASASCLAV
ncbi:hypothetical protein AEGHOMDF_0430 [Methylobacterium soli]|nr:hypothetical protein AEGHOMDF_0430 [Methylobacterium soli]